MKKLILFLSILALTVTASFAQAPQKFTYQAVVRDANNHLLASQSVGVQISILQGSVSGSSVYVENQNALTNANGLMTLEIGGGTVMNGDFATINWANGPYFLKTEIDPNGGTNYTVEGTQQLLSVPYALYAGSAANSFSGDYNDLTNQPQIPQIPENISYFQNDAGYITMDSVPVVPTNVSAFVNDDGYLTSYTETDPQFNAWDKDYNDLINIPAIPTVPTHVSAFTNDARYITMDSLPVDVSYFNNDVPYITESGFQLTLNEINTTFDTLNNTISDMNATIDSLSHRIAELEGTHTAPAVMTTGISNVAHTTATLNGSVVYSGGSTVAARGFCYGIEQNPTIESTTVSCGYGEGSFASSLQNLTSSTTYYVRAYATNVWGTSYGEQQSFTTLTEYVPSVEITAATDIDYTAFTCGGDVTDSGTYAVTARGICYATTPDPVMTGAHVHLGNGTGVFSITLTDLEPETTYYVRAYAVNAVGVAYSTPITVTTLTPSVPTVTTDSVSMYNECTGTVLADGGAPVTQRGFCYDTLPLPTVESNVVLAGDGLGEFEATLTSLPIGKLYFVRAFATNAKGTTYGQQFDFLAGCDTKTLTDYDGNVYNTVTIGTQCWMKENLRTTHYSDGWPMDEGAISSSTVAYYCYPNNWPGTYDLYGFLYNGKALMRDEEYSNSIPSGVQGVCPTGWHVPSDNEWSVMINYLKRQNEYTCDGGIGLAIADTFGWNESSGCNIGNLSSPLHNTTGFSARPAGFWYIYFHCFREGAYFWTSKGGGALCHAHFDGTNLAPETFQMEYMFSVRCLRDY